MTRGRPLLSSGGRSSTTKRARWTRLPTASAIRSSGRSVDLAMPRQADRQRPGQIGPRRSQDRGDFRLDRHHGDLPPSRRSDSRRSRHGRDGRVALIISQSGETTELEPVIDHFAAARIPIIAITGHARLDARRGRYRCTGPASLAGGRPGIGRADHLDDDDPGARRRAGDDGHAPEGFHVGPISAGFTRAARSARG